MSAPERIWLTDREIYGRGKPPEQWANPDKGALAAAYILVTAHEAAVAAARAEGMREAARIYADGEGWDYFGAAYDAIMAEASK